MTQRTSTVKNVFLAFLNGDSSPSPQSQRRRHSHAHPSTERTVARRHSTASLAARRNRAFSDARHNQGSKNAPALPDIPTYPLPRTTKPNEQSIADEYLREYMAQRGLLPPKLVYEDPSHDIKVSVATSGDVVFLPTISSSDDEYLQRLNGLADDVANELEPTNATPPSPIDTSDPLTSSTPAISHALNSRNSEELENVEESSVNADDHEAVEDSDDVPSTGIGGTAIDDESSDMAVESIPDNDSPSRHGPRVGSREFNTSNEFDSSMASYTFAIVLSITKPIKISHLVMELCARVKIVWNLGLPPSKTTNDESYTAGRLRWAISNQDFSAFVPLNAKSKAEIIENEHVQFDRKAKVFKIMNVETRKYQDKSKMKKELLGKIKNSSFEVMSPGDYIFMVPSVFSNNIPETLHFPSGRVNYRIRVALKADSGSDASSEGNNSSNTSTFHSSSASIASNIDKMSDSDSIDNFAMLNKHRKSSILSKVKKQLHISPHASKMLSNAGLQNVYTEYPIKVVRTPPAISESTANRPIYINRVWTESLAYEISFNQKYVPLGSEVPIKIKLAPIAKDVIVKRLRVSLNEKITFVSKNLEYEYDQVDAVAKDPYNPYYLDFAAKRRKERNLALLEVRTKEKGGRAMREEIIQNSVNENLLCIGNGLVGDDAARLEPFCIETTLEFPKYKELTRKSGKAMPPYGIDAYVAVTNPELDSQQHPHIKPSVIGFFAGRRNSLNSKSNSSTNNKEEKTTNDNKYHNDNLASFKDYNVSQFHKTRMTTEGDQEVKFHTKMNSTRRGLYLDSLHFTNIHSRHKLEVMLRISKPDSDNPLRMRHYEVLIDTPVFIVSELCSTSNIELPTYNMAMVSGETRTTREVEVNADTYFPPPTFEEAISVPNSPKFSPMASPEVRALYDPDLPQVQQLNLSRATSISGPSGTPESTTANNNPNSTDSNARFGNLDGLMFSEMGSPTRMKPSSTNPFRNNFDHANSVGTDAIFRKGYSMTANIDRAESPRKPHLPTDRLTQNDIELSKGYSISNPPEYDEVVRSK